MKRIAIPLLAILLGLGVAVGMYLQSKEEPTQPTETTPGEEQAQDPALPPDAAADPDAAPDSVAAQGGDTAADGQSDATDTPQQETAGRTPVPDLDDLPRYEGLHVVPGDYNEWKHLGSDDPEQPYKLKITFNGFGAGIQRITLAEYDALKQDDSPPYAIVNLPMDKAPAWTPYRANTLHINGQRVDLFAAKWQADEPVETDIGASITFRAPIRDGEDNPIAEVVRTYQIYAPTDDAPDRGYAIKVDQKVYDTRPLPEDKDERAKVKRERKPLVIELNQNAQKNLYRDSSSYLPDRYYATGYFDPDYGGRSRVKAEDSHRRFVSVIDEGDIWPNPQIKDNAELVWLGAENRYFAVVTYPDIPLVLTDPSQIPLLTETFPRVGMNVTETQTPKPNETAAVILLGSGPRAVEVGGAADLSFGIYAGPRKREVFEEPPYAALGFGELIRYNIGGMCAFCTFQWLAKGLLWLLNFFHAITFDWGVAIILLVICVRLLLHPITKRAQVNMMKMGKQMQTLQPEMEKLKTKYKDDQQALQREMMKLYREKGVNPAGFLGCAPMMLQTPIWIALYAMLYFAIELRHEPAFYGLFQAISGGHWHFLQDLSVADNFIRFVPPDQPAFRLTWLPVIEPEFRSLNLLPLLMAVVFFINQKFTTPPAANEQQAQQQKIMKFMVLLFPIFLYSAPSGLTLYITTSTLFGILDSYLVRKHVREQEEAGTLFQKKPRKPGGFMDRMSKVMERKQLEMQQKQMDMQKQQRPQRGKKRKR